MDEQQAKAYAKLAMQRLGIQDFAIDRILSEMEWVMDVIPTDAVVVMATKMKASPAKD